MKQTSQQLRPTQRQVQRARLGTPITKFRATVSNKSLTPHQRLVLLGALERLFEGIYTHLPLKRARYGFDPVQRLRILRTQVHDLMDDSFHAEVDDIFNRLRDAHTYYERPGVAGRVAALPCIVEMYGDVNNPRYIVSKVGDDGRNPGFLPGVEIESWNGVPIDRAVQRFADQESGGRADSMRSFALVTLTYRPLGTFVLPDEDEVVIGFRKVDAAAKPIGKRLYAKLQWRIIDAARVDKFRDVTAKKRKASSVRVRAINPAAAAIKKAKLLMYAPDAVRGISRAHKSTKLVTQKGATTQEFVTSEPGFLRAQTIRGSRSDEEFGYLRIFEFDVPSVRRFLNELKRLLILMPPRGLVIDIRGNPGGVVVAAEMALQFLTPLTIEPVRFSLLATDFVRTMCSRVVNRAEYAPWMPSLKAAIRNGELYSASFPITDPGKCNFAGQVYGGPVVLVADSTTYSSGDLFSAGFVDNNIGPLMCVGQSTGAGGASIWDYKGLRSAMVGSSTALPRLPEGGEIQFALLRATRVGPQLGTPIEDVGVGVIRKQQYVMTRDDLLHENRDMLARCVDWLSGQRHTVMKCIRGKKRNTIEVLTKGLDQLDLKLADFRLESVRLKDGATHTVSVPKGIRGVEVCGLKRGRLRQRRLIEKSSDLEKYDG